jgi:hypothetical protein
VDMCPEDGSHAKCSKLGGEQHGASETECWKVCRDERVAGEEIPMEFKELKPSAFIPPRLSLAIPGPSELSEDVCPVCPIAHQETGNYAFRFRKQLRF